MVPTASLNRSPAPMAAAMGSSISQTSRAPADRADSLMAFRSTAVAFPGTHISTRGLGRIMEFWCTFAMKCWSIRSVTWKSAMTPSFNGRIAVMLSGVRPSMRLASTLTAATDF